MEWRRNEIDTILRVKSVISRNVATGNADIGRKPQTNRTAADSKLEAKRIWR
jgi:hypothetical protein